MIDVEKWFVINIDIEKWLLGQLWFMIDIKKKVSRNIGSSHGIPRPFMIATLLQGEFHGLW